MGPMASTDTVSSLPGISLREVTFDAPLDRSNPDRGTIEVFARIVTGEGGEDRPYLVYLQGGPGSEAPRPTGDPFGPSWLERALRDFRVVMIDQRGTGRSTPVGLDAPLAAGAGLDVATLGEATPQQQAEYLTHFRSDEIVADCEQLREILGVRRWSLLGQSFGGFCIVRYLSAASDSIEHALLTGGLTSVGVDPVEVYAETWRIMAAKSRRHYRRYPEDHARMRRLMDLAAEGGIVLPDGSTASPARLKGLGMLLGNSAGPARLHYLLELEPTSPAFRHDLAACLPFGGRNPLYAVIHESCWADGVATRFAAERAMPDEVREDPTLLGGEHVSPVIFDEDPELRPWKECAHILAEHEWPRLYDEDALRSSDVASAAAVYADDAYVPMRYSLQTAALMPRLHPWITNEYEHNGLGPAGERILDRLLGLATGRNAL